MIQFVVSNSINSCCFILMLFFGLFWLFTNIFTKNVIYNKMLPVHLLPKSFLIIHNFNSIWIYEKVSTKFENQFETRWMNCFDATTTFFNCLILLLIKLSRIYLSLNQRSCLQILFSVRLQCVYSECNNKVLFQFNFGCSHIDITNGSLESNQLQQTSLKKHEWQRESNAKFPAIAWQGYDHQNYISTHF